MDALDAQQGWYLFAMVATVFAAASNTRVDCWLVLQEKPYGLRAQLVIGLRWAFFCGVLMFAFLIDSRRVPYEETGLWLLLTAGALGVVALRVVTTQKDRD